MLTDTEAIRSDSRVEARDPRTCCCITCQGHLTVHPSIFPSIEIFIAMPTSLHARLPKRGVCTGDFVCGSDLIGPNLEINRQAKPAPRGCENAPHFTQLQRLEISSQPEFGSCRMSAAVGCHGFRLSVVLLSARQAMK